MASSSSIQLHILHKMNVNSLLLQTLLWTQTDPHKLQHQRPCLHADDIRGNCVIDLLDECSHMCSKLCYYVSYNDFNKFKEANNLHKIFEPHVMLRNYWICMKLEHWGAINLHKIYPCPIYKDHWSPNKGLLELLEYNESEYSTDCSPVAGGHWPSQVKGALWNLFVN